MFDKTKPTHGVTVPVTPNLDCSVPFLRVLLANTSVHSRAFAFLNHVRVSGSVSVPPRDTLGSNMFKTRLGHPC